MDVFGASDMVARGNFISLMFFVLALGSLVAYFVMGWATNVIAQVRSSHLWETNTADMYRNSTRGCATRSSTIPSARTCASLTGPRTPSAP
jgi:ATP-binding cassette, subfamily B (MDR/TAP), member 1